MSFCFSLNSIIILAATTLIFHGLILINTGNYFDGWYLAGWADRQSWESIKVPELFLRI